MEQAAKKRRVRVARSLIGVALLALLVGLPAYFNSNSFREIVRARVVTELERMTGGRVELQSFTWNLAQLRFVAKGLIIHGLEGPGEEPYARAQRVALRLKITSLLSRQVALREVVIDRLAVHLIVNPDGKTNQPFPGGAAPGAGLSASRLFDLAIGHLEINGGSLLLNQERIPFDAAGESFSANLSYSRAEGGYDGALAVLLASARWRNSPPMSGELDAHFLMRAGETHIKSLTIKSGKSLVQASGMLRHYDRPQIDLQYRASLDLPEAAKQAGITNLRAGLAEVKGNLDYRANRVSSEGQAGVHGLSWIDASFPLRVSGVDGSFAFTITPETITVPRFMARLFGGNAQGSLQITNWNASPGNKSPARKGVFDLELFRAQVSQMAAAFSSARLPWNKIDLAGAASGDMKASWTGTPKNALAAIRLDVVPPSNPSAREVPVTARMIATYHGGGRVLDVAGLNLSTRSIHLNLVGELGSRSAKGHLAVHATSLHEVQPVLDALRPGSRIPVTVEGRASFNGTIGGAFQALSARGRVELENFETEIAWPGKPPAESSRAAAPVLPSRIHWDSLASDVSYSPANLTLQHGLLRRGTAQIAFSGMAGLRHGSFDESASPLALDLHVSHAALEDAQSLAGMSYPVTGLAALDAHVTGVLGNLRGSGSLRITKLTVAGESFQGFRSQIQIAGAQVRLNNLFLSHNAARITGSFAWDAGNKNFDFDLTGSAIDLATIHRLQGPRLALGGMAGFHLAGSGGARAKVINGRVDVAHLALNHQALGNANVVLETRGTELVVRGRGAVEDANLNLDGTVQLRDDDPAQMTLEFARVPLDSALQAYLGGQARLRSSISGALHIRGPLRTPRALNIAGDISQFSADLGVIKLQNDSPIHVSMDNTMARADQFHLVGEDTDIFVQGGVGTAGDHALDLHARGRFNLKLAQQLNPNILAYGPADFTVDIAGTAAHPRASGHFTLADAGVSLADLPNGLSHINGSLVFAQDRVQIEKLTAHSGGGDLTLGGFLAYRKGLYFDLTATGKDVRLRYPPGVSASADATLHYAGSAKKSQLSGDITVIRFGLDPRFDFGVLLARSKSPLELTSLNPFLDNLGLDVHILSTPELRVETSLAKLSGDIDLRVRGTAARPAVLGRVTIAEGDVFFNGTKYRLERGEVTFSNPLAIEPVVNIEMSARVQNYDISIGLHGSLTAAGGLRLTYRSDPPLSNSDIISLLAFGQPRGQEVYNAAQPGQNSADAAASNAILGQALDAAVSDRVQRLFGASRVKIDPQFIGQQNNPSARVTLAQTINNNITLTYSASLTQSAQTVVQVEYAVDKNISIVAVRDLNGVLGFDLHIRRRKK